MSLLQPELSTPHTPSTGHKVAGTALVAGAALLLVGAGLALGTQHSPAPAVDPCAMPGGTSLDNLGSHDANLVTRRLLACNDLRFGRITGEEYKAAIAALEKQWTPEPPPPARVVWASSVRGFSTQYTTSSWSAAQALGAPNVPVPGDNANAWASLGADDRDEWLEVGFENAGRVSGFEIHESFNPGAIDRVELIMASGTPQTVQVRGTRVPGAKHRFGCTAEPVVALRVHIASTQVAGWNEIDAIGVVPCGRQ